MQHSAPGRVSRLGCLKNRPAPRPFAANRATSRRAKSTGLSLSDRPSPRAQPSPLGRGWSATALSPAVAGRVRGHLWLKLQNRGWHRHSCRCVLPRPKKCRNSKAVAAAVLLIRILVLRRICRRIGAAHTLGERLCRPVLRKGSAFPGALKSKSRSDSWVEAVPQPARRTLAEQPRKRGRRSERQSLSARQGGRAAPATAPRSA